MSSLTAFVRRKRDHSLRVFGPIQGVTGVLAHLRKELIEVEQDTTDLTEWIDVILLGIEGAWRSGHSPEEVVAAILAKQKVNESRDWPDWREVDPDHPIEHVRDPVGCPLCWTWAWVGMLYDFCAYESDVCKHAKGGGA